MHGVHLVAASPNLSSKTLEEMKRLVIYKPRLLKGARGVVRRAECTLWGFVEAARAA